MSERIPEQTPPDLASWWTAMKGEARRRGVLKFSHDGLVVLQLPGDADPPATPPPTPSPPADML